MKISGREAAVKCARLVVTTLLVALGGYSLAAPPNKPPTVAITSPSNGATFSAPATITISASASDSDGTVARVDFYQGTNRIGTSTNAPYTMSWSGVAAGSYSLTAQAVDNLGATRTSSGVSVTVAGAKVIIATPANGTFVYGTSATVSGSFTGASDSTVLVDNGNTTRVAALSGGNSYTANIPIYVGPNTLRVTVARRDRTVDSASIVVNGNAPPLLTFTAPSTTAFNAPANITLVVDAVSPASSISKVDFFRNGTLLGTANAPPYQFAWSNVVSGNYALTATATDNNGYTASTSLLITVNGPNASPIVAMTSPSNGATFSAPATIALAASASDPDGSITLVEFLQNGSVVGVTNNAPYAMTLGGVPTGSYTFAARATDNRSAVTTSAPIVVSVGSPNNSPSVTLTSPLAGSTFAAPATITLAASASDTDGTIAKVDFYQGATLLGAATSAPYTFTWPNVAVGSYTITAKATDDRGAVTASQPVSISVDNNIPPTVNLTAPLAGSHYFSPATIGLSANASDPDGSIAKVDFYQGSTLIGSASSPPYSYTWTNVPSANYTLTARATDNRGGVATSQSVNISVSANVPPTASLTAPFNGAHYFAPATIALSAVATDTDGSIARVDFYQGSTVIGSATSAPYNFTWANVPAGSYTLTARAIDDQAGTATSNAVNVLVAGPTFAIVSPTQNATIDSDLLTVTGTLQAVPNAGITVNGVAAAIDSAGRFYANDVPLVPGANTIQATLTTIDGLATSQTVNVTSTGRGPVRITATPTQGIAPLDIMFDVAPRADIAIRKVEIDGSGTGSIDQTLMSEPWSSTFTYTGTGALNATIRVTDASGTVYSQQIPIVLFNPATLDQTMRAVWSGFTSALAAGDKGAAMRFMDASAQQRYGPALDVLLPNLPEIVRTFSDPQTMSLSEGLGEYAINRTINGENRIFFIYFGRGGDGVWRLGTL